MAAQGVGGHQARSHRECQKPLFGLLKGKRALRHSGVAGARGAPRECVRECVCVSVCLCMSDCLCQTACDCVCASDSRQTVCACVMSVRILNCTGCTDMTHYT